MKGLKCLPSDAVMAIPIKVIPENLSGNKLGWKAFMSLFILSCFALNGSAQLIGKCIDTAGRAIPYLNVSLKGKNGGTVCNENGFFILDDKALEATDSVVFSHIHYQSQTMAVRREDTMRVVLLPARHLLKEIEVKASPLAFNKKKTLGVKAPKDRVLFSFVTQNLGAEIGTIIQLKKGQVCKLQKVGFHVSEMAFQSAKLRINFYKVLSGDSIERIRMNPQDIIQEIRGPGVVEIDLTRQNFILEHDFLVAMEWIDYTEKVQPEKRRYISISSWVYSGPFCSRSNNATSWHVDKVTLNAGLGMYVVVAH